MYTGGVALFLGIDVGTSAVKALLCDERGGVAGTASEEYPLLQPRAGWTEQETEEWWRGTCAVAKQALARAGLGARDVTGIGLSGQMHGAVLLDRAALATGGTGGRALRPAILWNDQRTARECGEIEEAVGGRRRLVELVGNAALTGFTLPKMLWVRRNEPDVWRRTALVVMPKDFVRWRMTGEVATDVGDASGTLLFDVGSRTWSEAVCAAVGVDRGLLPRVIESGDVAGRLSGWAAGEMGLAPGTPVVAGSGDNMMGAIGAGIVREGMALATLGTSGVIYAHTNVLRPDLGDPSVCGRTHAMCAATGAASKAGGWCATGCMLSAAGALAWAHGALWPGASFDELLAEAVGVPIGCEGLVFLPHLTGERCPHPDPAARGAWVGLSSRHTRGHLARAILEGVTMTMGQILDLFGRIGVKTSRVRLGGGGAKSALWRQMQADVYGLEVALPNTEEGPALGAALLAAVAAGAWGSIEEACGAVIRDSEVLEPDAASITRYAELRSVYAGVYPALAPTFARLQTGASS